MPTEDRLKYKQFTQTINDNIEEYQSNISKLKSQLGINESQNRYVCLAISTYKLRIASEYLKQNDMHVSLFESSDKDALESARKSLGDIILLLRNHFDITFSRGFAKNPAYLEELDQLTPQRKLNLLTQFEYLCSQLKNAYGNTSKYLVPLANLYGDTCGFALNIIDIPKCFMIMRNLQHPEYNTVKNLLTLIETMFSNASQLFIDIHSVSDSDNKEHIGKALKLLDILETYYRLSGKKEELSELSRKKQTWERFLSN